jgi:hypothetical protein
LHQLGKNSNHAIIDDGNRRIFFTNLLANFFITAISLFSQLMLFAISPEGAHYLIKGILRDMPWKASIIKTVIIFRPVAQGMACFKLKVHL